MNGPRLGAAVTLLGALLLHQPATAAWPHDPYSNLPLCTSSGGQYLPVSTPDGAGGAIVVWIDQRGGTYDIYAQRVNAAGVVQWAANGVALCTTAFTQWYPAIASDGAGGAIVAWEDDRGGAGFDVYAQRVNSAGVVQWAANGVALCTAAGSSTSLKAIRDGAGGAVVAWEDTRNGNQDLFAQRVNAAGIVQWAANGVGVCTAALTQKDVTVVPDGTGGGVFAWSDSRGGIEDIYAQRLNGAGVAQWAANGIALCSEAQSQLMPVAVPDGGGGAIVAWDDARSGDEDIYVQRVNSAGTALWTSGGVALCTAAFPQYQAQAASDGAGGAIVTWQDFRSNSTLDVYAQRVDAGGVAQWTANGTALCTAARSQTNPCLIADGSGGAIAVWQDFRGGLAYDQYAQRVSGTGVNQWTSNGVLLSGVNGNQYATALVSDELGGAIVAWQDERVGAAADIYAQRIERFGQLGSPEPVITSARDVPNDQGGRVKVSWSASYLDVDPLYGVYEYRVWRSVPPSWLASGAATARRGVTADPDDAAATGRLFVDPLAVSDYAWEYVGATPAAISGSYSMVVSTEGDSVPGSNPLTAFRIEARASSSLSSDRWFSAPDSGYSVDNLAPATPAPFTGQYAAGTTALHWNRNIEADLAGYRLYRGASVAFVPGPGNLVAALPDTGYADVAGAPFVYKLTAVDVHGNESPVATLVPAGTLDAGDSPAALAFAPPAPSPARDVTTLRWTLSRPGPVRLAVYDAAGRRVALLRDGALAAGAHSAAFALRDEAGRALASGIYLVRLEAEGRVLTRRLAAIR